MAIPTGADTSPVEGHLGQSSRLVLKFTALSSSLAIKQRAIDIEANLEDSLSDLIGIVPSIVDQVEAIANAGIIMFLHDITAATLSEITLYIFKVSLAAAEVCRFDD